MYTMDIEKLGAVVKEHGFHLGTNFEVAEILVRERLRADRDIVSITLRRDGELVSIALRRGEKHVRFYEFPDLDQGSVA